MVEGEVDPQKNDCATEQRNGDRVGQGSMEVNGIWLNDYTKMLNRAAMKGESNPEKNKYMAEQSNDRKVVTIEQQWQQEE